MRVRRSVGENVYNRVIFHKASPAPRDITEPIGIADAGGSSSARLDNSIETVMSEFDDFALFSRMSSVQQGYA